MVPTKPADLKRINHMFNQMVNPMSNLYGRWLDEKQYEDIADYGKAVTNMLPKGFTLIKMNKSPFGFDFSIDTPAVYRFEVRSKTMNWQRIK